MDPSADAARPLSLLVVDDLADAAASTALLLSLHGYAARVAGSGEEDKVATPCAGRRSAQRLAQGRPLGGLGLRPQLLHLRQRRLPRALAALRQRPLDRGKSALEFQVGGAV